VAVGEIGFEVSRSCHEGDEGLGSRIRFSCFSFQVSGFEPVLHRLGTVSDWEECLGMGTGGAMRSAELGVRNAE